MSIKHIAALAALLFLLSVSVAYAADASVSYIELPDAPSITVDWSKGNVQAVTLHSNRTLTFANAQKGGRYLLIVKQDATGYRTVTWPPAVHWPGENQLPPQLTTTANRKDYLTFIFDGASYDAVSLAQNY
jgi:hypothetical protein